MPAADDFGSRNGWRHLGVSGVVTGEDFTFGKGRGGNPALLRDRAAALASPARRRRGAMDNGGPISSSRIRAALKPATAPTATRLLTRPFAIRGWCSMATSWAAPSAFPPPTSISAATCARAMASMPSPARLPDGRVLHGAANLGIRPTFDPPKELLEPHFFDFRAILWPVIEVPSTTSCARGEVRQARRADGPDRARIATRCWAGPTAPAASISRWRRSKHSRSWDRRHGS
jgi:FAD synthase